ncbi:unnamed protein product [Acanthosepion pharaonis]|uniref:Uncharacterized protein n=1 Tax=Acanthosepion pharaonis TaxID=158019 RepID=A0A812DLA9_ACAPH|nr:unnamed protein product [Sepia pharaonis]
MVYNLSAAVQDGQSSDPDSSGIQSYGSSASSYIQSALGKDSDQDSGRLSIPDSLSQCSFTDTVSAWDTSIISLSPTTSHFNIHTGVVDTEDSLPSEVIKSTKLSPEKTVPKKQKLKQKVKSLKDKLMGGTKPTPESFNETVLSIPPDKTVLQWVTVSTDFTYFIDFFLIISSQAVNLLLR